MNDSKEVNVNDEDNDRLDWLISDSPGLFADVTFVCGASCERVQAHKALLAARSRVFAAMFFSQFAESGAGTEVRVPDIEADTFRQLLRCMYGARTVVTLDNVAPFLLAAKKYAVEPLESQCRRFMEGQVQADALVLLEQLPSVLEDERRACMERVARDIGTTLAHSEVFMAIKETTLCALVASHALSVRERDMFLGVVRWGIHKLADARLTVDVANPAEFLAAPAPLLAALRDVLKNVLPLVRFPVMTVEDLAIFVAPTGLVDNRALLQIFRAVNTADTAAKASAVHDPAAPMQDLPHIAGYPAVKRLAHEPVRDVAAVDTAFSHTENVVLVDWSSYDGGGKRGKRKKNPSLLSSLGDRVLRLTLQVDGPVGRDCSLVVWNKSRKLTPYPWEGVNLRYGLCPGHWPDGEWTVHGPPPDTGDDDDVMGSQGNKKIRCTVYIHHMGTESSRVASQSCVFAVFSDDARTRFVRSIDTFTVHGPMLAVGVYGAGAASVRVLDSMLVRGPLASLHEFEVGRGLPVDDSKTANK